MASVAVAGWVEPTALETTTLTLPSVAVAGTRALICVWLTKLRGAGFPSMATVTPPRVVGYTLLMIALSQVVAAEAKFLPMIVTQDPASRAGAPLIALAMLVMVGIPVVAVEAGVKT